eukprot:TRINITY_DN4395_c0_g4_i11.p1 TRINITY_DN4395_c0_g4~~TRINITY_DN4395_c0_g4_i11.p1  ORF type:complete len:605 (+),score=148.95 TRINITY_DN4395_c0_g4_i11:88-1902(+)
MSSGSEDDSLATEMEIGGEKWIGREVEVYWDKPPDQRGFYGGVVSSYSIVHSPVRDIEYKVKYNDYGKPNVPVSEFEDEVVDAGWRFKENKYRKELHRIMSIRKARGVLQPVKIRERKIKEETKEREGRKRKEKKLGEKLRKTKKIVQPFEIGSSEESLPKEIDLDNITKLDRKHKEKNFVATNQSPPIDLKPIPMAFPKIKQRSIRVDPLKMSLESSEQVIESIKWEECLSESEEEQVEEKEQEGENSQESEIDLQELVSPKLEFDEEVTEGLEGPGKLKIENEVYIELLPDFSIDLTLGDDLEVVEEVTQVQQETPLNIPWVDDPVVDAAIQEQHKQSEGAGSGYYDPVVDATIQEQQKQSEGGAVLGYYDPVVDAAIQEQQKQGEGGAVLGYCDPVVDTTIQEQQKPSEGAVSGYSLRQISKGQSSKEITRERKIETKRVVPETSGESRKESEGKEKSKQSTTITKEDSGTTREEAQKMTKTKKTTTGKEISKGRLKETSKELTKESSKETPKQTKEMSKASGIRKRKIEDEEKAVVSNKKTSDDISPKKYKRRNQLVLPEGWTVTQKMRTSGSTAGQVDKSWKVKEEQYWDNFFIRSDFA